MQAVIQTGGKQYLVEAGQILDIEKIEGEEGAKVVFDEVYLTTDGKTTQVGKPSVKGAKVEAKIVKQFRDAKKIVYKFKSKKRYERNKSHRQSLTKVEIVAVA